MELGLAGKSAIVTGAGRGIGRAIVLAFAREGADVAVNDIYGELAESVAGESRALGVNALAIGADVTRLEQVEGMVQRVLEEFGRVDVLVNNVGIAWVKGGPISRSLFADSDNEEWETELDVTVRSTENCCKAVLEHMIGRKTGKIVNISSMSADFPIVRENVYAAGKGWVNSFTMSLAAELGQFGINVNAVSPGLIRSTRSMLAEAKRESDVEAYEKRMEFEKRMLSLCPLGKRGEPDDIANAVVFLASDAARYITGRILKVDGGMPMLLYYASDKG